MDYKFIVVGAGISGLVLAEKISKKLNKRVLVIEKKNHIGGNCYDYNYKGIYIHKYGPHIFHSNYKEVWDYLSQFTEWIPYQHKVLGFIDGKKVPIPFNLNTLYGLFPKEYASKLENKLLKTYNFGERISIYELKQSKDTDLKFLANYVYEKVFLNYTKKQWGVSPEKLNPEVLKRVPVVISRDDRYFSDKYQGIPKDGYTAIFERILLENKVNIKVLLNTDFKEILKFDGKKFYLLNQEFKGIVIYTAPIDELFNFKFGYLPYRSLKLIFKKLPIKQFQEVAVVNYPNNYDFTRITEFKHFTKGYIDYDAPETVILEEYPKHYEPAKDIPYYPFFTKEAEEQYFKYRELAEKVENLILIGRLAEYKYYNMDVAVKRALEMFEEKIA